MLWAERLLSPDWRGLWEPGSRSPVDYDYPARSKTVLLIVGSEAADEAETARLMGACARLRERDVALYVIDYLAPTAASLALQDCAGAPMLYFRIEEETALRDAFLSLAGFLIQVRFPGA